MNNPKTELFALDTKGFEEYEASIDDENERIGTWNLEGRNEERIIRLESGVNKVLEIQEEVQRSLRRIETTQAAILAILCKTTKKEIPTLTDELFPINTVEELDAAEQKIMSNTAEYTTQLRNIIKNDIVKNLDSILGCNIITDFNYDGVNDKSSFKKYSALNNAMYNASKVDGSNKQLYIQSLRQAFKVHKGRLAKRRYDIKKKKKNKA